MKSFALLTTVSLISLSTLATVRPVMALESRQPAETRIAQGNNQDAIGHYNRGVDYIQQEKYDLALAEFTKAININPRFAEAYLNRGILYAGQGKPDLALSDYNQATLIPETPMLTTIAGLFTTNRGNPTSPCPISIRRSTLIPD
jgi:Tfp pilus assembly protein PilF